MYLDLLIFLIKEDSHVQEKELMPDICPVRHAAGPAIVTESSQAPRSRPIRPGTVTGKLDL
jgi:hypothetical protein